MYEPLTIPELFANSVVNPQIVVCYLWQQNTYYKEAIKTPCHPLCLEMVQQADLVDAEIRSILAGNAIRLTRLYRIIRAFIALNPTVGKTLTSLVLGDIHQTLLQNEWYELLDRFQMVCSRVQKHFKLSILNTHSSSNSSNQWLTFI